MSHLPYPPLLDELGLESALRWYIEEFSERSKIKVELELASDLGRLLTELETAILRIMQECLTSIHRHSGKTATIHMFKLGFQISVVVNSELQEFQRLKCPETVSL
jgi:signal transduction histidine kinase